MHDASAFIFETANAVLAQTWTNFEWLVIDDGSGDASVDILESLRDPRIRVERVEPSGRIGWLKQAATSLARGEFLVELDHDDFLVPTALEKIVAAFRADPSIGMVYSNFAEWFAGTREFHVYQVPFWKYRDTPWNGMVAKEALAPDAMGTFVADGVERPVMDAMNVCPNHVRAFRADALRRAGGYRNLVWADDYDVMIRMFLTSNLKKIDELLYVQRMGTNTWTRNTKLLWPCFGEIRRHHLPALHARYRELGLPVLPSGSSRPTARRTMRGHARSFTHVRRDSRLGAAAFASAALTSWNSPGFLEADEVSHLGYARSMHRDARLLVDVWGRPAVTLIHAIPSHAGTPRCV
jgi:glycosyltransferase involved in cell wall biosynthesis